MGGGPSARVRHRSGVFLCVDERTSFGRLSSPVYHPEIRGVTRERLQCGERHQSGDAIFLSLASRSQIRARRGSPLSPQALGAYRAYRNWGQFQYGRAQKGSPAASLPAAGTASVILSKPIWDGRTWSTATLDTKVRGMLGAISIPSHPSQTRPSTSLLPVVVSVLLSIARLGVLQMTIAIRRVSHASICTQD